MSAILPAAAAAMTYLATAPWRPEAREMLDDPVGIEAALAQAGVAPAEASVLYGVAIRRLHADAADTLQDAVGWTTLDNHWVLDPRRTEVDRGQAACSLLAGRDPVPGERSLRVLRGRPHSSGHTATGGPEVVLATTWSDETGPQEHAWVRLAPGDTVLQVTVEPRGRQPRSELIELRSRRLGRLRMPRDGDGAEVCFDRPER